MPGLAAKASWHVNGVAYDCCAYVTHAHRQRGAPCPPIAYGIVLLDRQVGIAVVVLTAYQIDVAVRGEGNCCSTAARSGRVSLSLPQPGRGRYHRHPEELSGLRLLPFGGYDDGIFHTEGGIRRHAHGDGHGR